MFQRIKRFLLEPPAPRRGRVDVIEATERGRLIPEQMDVHSVGGNQIVVTARPKASMKLRVYRVSTGEWSEPIEVRAADIKVESKE